MLADFTAIAEHERLERLAVVAPGGFGGVSLPALPDSVTPLPRVEGGQWLTRRHEHEPLNARPVVQREIIDLVGFFGPVGRIVEKLLR